MKLNRLTLEQPGIAEINLLNAAQRKLALFAAPGSVMVAAGRSPALR